MAIQQSKLVWNVLFSFIDPFVADAMARVAKRIPMESRVREKASGIALGVLKSVVETLTEGRSPLVAALVEKATDAGDFFTGALHATNLEQPIRDIATWFQESRDRLVERRTKTTNDDELKLIEFELELRATIAQEFSRRREAVHASPKEERGSFFESATKSLRSTNQRLRKKLAEKNRARKRKRGV